MKKAKEYAKAYLENPTNETLAKIVVEFYNECNDLIKQRHAQTDSACLAILNEQDKKWRAFARLAVTDQYIIRENGFEIVIKTEMPFVYTQWKRKP